MVKNGLWFEGQKTWTIVFTDEDLTELLKILESQREQQFNPVTDRGKMIDRIRNRIYFQMSSK